MSGSHHGCLGARSNPESINYTVILLSQSFSCFMGGFCNPSLGALGMDILPQDSRGRVLHATRDQQIASYAGFRQRATLSRFAASSV